MLTSKRLRQSVEDSETPAGRFSDVHLVQCLLRRTGCEKSLRSPIHHYYIRYLWRPPTSLSLSFSPVRVTSSFRMPRRNKRESHHSRKSNLVNSDRSTGCQVMFELITKIDLFSTRPCVAFPHSSNSDRLLRNESELPAACYLCAERVSSRSRWDYFSFNDPGVYSARLDVC